jgi:DNA-binding transcriptional ArsR family regulator
MRSGPSTERLTAARGAAHEPVGDARMSDLDLVFGALADPTRRAILTDLLQGDRSVGDLAAPHAMSLAAISKHLQILTRAGLVIQTRAGRTTTCRLDPDALRGAGIWLQGVGGFDPEDYDALEARLGLSDAEG